MGFDLKVENRKASVHDVRGSFSDNLSLGGEFFAEYNTLFDTTTKHAPMDTILFENLLFGVENGMSPNDLLALGAPEKVDLNDVSWKYLSSEIVIAPTLEYSSPTCAAISSEYITGCTMILRGLRCESHRDSSRTRNLGVFALLSIASFELVSMIFEINYLTSELRKFL
jgi:hypothetical protein